MTSIEYPISEACSQRILLHNYLRRRECVQDKYSSIQNATPRPGRGKKFVMSLDSVKEGIYENLKKDVGMKITDEEERQHKNVKECYACVGPFTSDNPKTHDHCHITGKYRGRRVLSVILS